MVAEPTEAERRVVWKPLPGSQELAVSCPAHVVLYEGTRGPGKTEAQLMAFRRLVGVGYGRFWRGVLFDREYKQLDDVVNRSKRYFPQFEDGARFLASPKDYKWVWPTGEELLFRQAAKLDDYWSFHGQEFPFIGWNELCKYPTSEVFDAMMSCNRASFVPELHSPGKRLPELPLQVFATANPLGPGHNWVKARFIDPAPPGVVVATERELFNPRTQQRETIVRTQVRLFGSWLENPYLPPAYVAELMSIKDENRRRAWVEGDWDIVAGGALDDLWRTEVHVVPRFPVPAGWVVDRSLDWGSSRPFSVGWWAEANGEEVELPGGRKWCPPRGTLVRVADYYGSRDIGTNTGTRLSARDVALNVLKHERSLLDGGWLAVRPQPGPADSSIYDTQDPMTDSIAKVMEDHGVAWVPANKSPGSRKNGLQLVRDRMEASLNREGPGIYWMDNCLASKALLPVLPRDPDDPDDVDTEAEDHLYDETRYRVLAGNNRFAVSIPTRLVR